MERLNEAERDWVKRYSPWLYSKRIAEWIAAGVHSLLGKPVPRVVNYHLVPSFESLQKLKH
jgi:hypothetical protein